MKILIIVSSSGKIVALEFYTIINDKLKEITLYKNSDDPENILYSDLALTNLYTGTVYKLAIGKWQSYESGTGTAPGSKELLGFFRPTDYKPINVYNSDGTGPIGYKAYELTGLNYYDQARIEEGKELDNTGLGFLYDVSMNSFIEIIKYKEPVSTDATEPVFLGKLDYIDQSTFYMAFRIATSEHKYKETRHENWSDFYLIKEEDLGGYYMESAMILEPFMQ